ncbi:MAG: type II secretion system F family protein [Candidatus Nanopelagicales bacterium]|nr:type II secretion system F family protein [Candidatus Nanopelagicales bacterium]
MTKTLEYDYAVRDRTGGLVKGRLRADSPATVATKLTSMGYAPVSIRAANSGMRKELRIPGFGNKVGLKDLAVMSRQFATMINSGLSLLRALTILEEQTECKPLARVLSQVRSEVEGGRALSVALGAHPTVFPPLMVNMCRAGEVGGFLDQSLLQVAANYEAEVKLRGKVKSAMTYPVVVAVMAVLGVGAMLLFIVPTFAQMFASLGGTLPAPTRVLMILSTLLKNSILYVVVGLVALGLLWRKFKRHPKVRDVVDPMKLRMPVFGPLFQKIALSRFTRNLGTMIHSGVPILQALDIVADTSGNVVVGRAVRDVQESVRRGESLSRPLEEHAVFPAMVVQMLSVGEDTGALDEMLHKISEFYDQEVEATTEALTSLIEPIMIAVMGTVIGGMIIALYMPIFKVFDLIQ